jgi:hypothetical protein
MTASRESKHISHHHPQPLIKVETRKIIIPKRGCGAEERSQLSQTGRGEMRKTPSFNLYLQEPFKKNNL